MLWVCATNLAARKFAQIDKPCPALDFCISDAISKAETIMRKIDALHLTAWRLRTYCERQGRAIFAHRLGLGKELSGCQRNHQPTNPPIKISSCFLKLGVERESYQGIVGAGTSRYDYKLSS